MRKIGSIKNIIIFVLIVLICLITLSFVSAATTISSCTQNINSSGVYILSQSLTSTTTCLVTNSSNVEIDCAGYIITYGTAGAANSIGINAINPSIFQTNLTIKNCIIMKPSVGGSGGNGIMLTRFANSTIFNNTIGTNGTSGNKGIYILTGSNGNNISRNTIVTSGTSTTNYGIWLYTGSADTIIEYNNINSGKGAATTDNYGIRVDDPRANITGNIVYTFGSGDSNYGIYSYTSTSARIINNTIYTSGTTGNNRGILVSSSDSNYIANNTINTTGQASPGIYVTTSGSLNILNNKINSTADSIYITSATLTDFTLANISRDNTRFGRNITVYGGGALTLPCPNNAIINNPSDGGLKFFSCNNITVQNWYRPNRDTDGLLFVNSDYNKIINNTINGGLEALDMVNTAGMCDNNTIANNTFSSYGYLDSYGAYAIHLYGTYNIITGNNLSTNGITSGNNGINIQNDFNNITNNIITTSGTSGNLGINLESGATDNLIQNNTITTSGTSGNSGIYFTDTNVRNIVRNNTITATGITSGNLGIRLVSNSNNNTIEYNQFYTKGLTSGNNGIDLSSSSNNLFRFNNIYAGYEAGTTDNDAISLVSSQNNTFMNNLLFANGTATSITSSAIFLQSNSVNNTFINNIITKSVGNAIELDFSTTYPHRNTFQNNSLNNINGSDLFFLDVGINGTSLVDQSIGKYNFTGVGGTMTIENTQFGKIIFTSPITGNNGNLTNDVQIRFNFAQVSSSKPGLNSSANISFYNLPTNFYNPIIKKDGTYECNSSTIPSCINSTSLNAGNISFNVTGWSNYSIENSTDIIFPNINVFSPQAINYAVNNIFLNYSVSDNLALGSCWYKIDSSPNINLPSCSTASISGLLDGSHTIQVYVNDTTGNINSSQVTFSITSNPPQYSNIQSSTSLIYSETQSNFNITWTSANSISSVLLESNFSGTPRNYSMINLGNNKYTFSAILPGGTFYWKSYANDSFGNINSSSTQLFTINRAQTETILYLNTQQIDLDLSYGMDTNATAYGINGTPVLYRDNNLVSNPEINILGVSNYNYTAVIPENQNYTGSSKSLMLSVHKAAPQLNLFLNSQASDLSIDYNTISNATAIELNSGDSDLIYDLYKDNTIVSNPDVGILDANTYVYVYNTTGGQNYTSGFISRTLTINTVNPTLYLFLNNQQSNLQVTYGTQTNITGTSLENISLQLLRNSQSVSNPDINVLASGNYTYLLYFPGNQNYNLKQKTYRLEVLKATPNITLTINSQASDISVSLGSLIEINASDSSQNVELYEDNVLIGNSSHVSVQRNYTTAGNKIITAVLQESENYISRNITRTITVLDSDSPHFSNLLSSPNSPTSYSQSQNYQFNSTWTDNIGIDNVILEFNGINYSYSQNQVQKNNNEYYFSISNLPVSSYSYKWYANDTSGNIVSTQPQTYTIDKAITALFITLSPSSSVNYNTQTSLSCSANNPESVLLLTRNSQTVSNPDSVILGAGTYNYACTSIATQNYTSASSTTTLTINKAAPTINLTLNNLASDLSFTGGDVSIQASLINPTSGILNLSINNNIISNNSPIINTTTFSIVGSYIISASYSGDENYTSGSISRTITVTNPSTPNSGGGGGGGGGGTSSPVVQIIKGIEITPISEVILKAGETKKISVNVKNSGNTFLNNCKLIGTGQYSSWVSSESVKGISAGEITEFILTITMPSEENSGKYPVNFEINCKESLKSAILPVEILEQKVNLKIIKTERVRDKLSITYSVEETTGKNQDGEIEIILLSNTNQRTAELKENKQIQANSLQEFTSVLDISPSLSGNFNLLINYHSEFSSSFVQESLVLSSPGISGLSILNSDRSDSLISIILIIVFIIFLILILRRILKLRRISKASKPEKNIETISSKHSKLEERKERKEKQENHEKEKKSLLSLFKKKQGEIFFDYLEIENKQEQKNNKLLLVPFTMTELSQVNQIQNLLRENNIVLIDISKVKNQEDFKKAVGKIKSTIQALNGNIAGFSDLIIASPNFSNFN